MTFNPGRSLFSRGGMSLKPFASQASSNFQRTGLFEKMRRAWHYFKLRLDIEPRERGFVKLEHLRIIFPHDEKHRRFNLGR